MTLNFPNESRSYDQGQRRIRFWGHDGAIEVPFFLDENAIFRLFPRTKNVEAGILAAFDEGRGRICEVAVRAYAAGPGRAFYTLKAADF